MTPVLYLAGLIIGAAVFFTMLHFFHESKERVSRKLGREKPGAKSPSALEAGKVTYPNIKSIPPGERMCPLCRKSLTKYEPLYASQVETESGSRILIHGCGYCYKEESGSSG